MSRDVIPETARLVYEYDTIVPYGYPLLSDVVPGAEHENYAAGTSFSAAAEGPRGRDVALDEDLLGAAPYVVVVANQTRVATEEDTTIDVELYGPPPPEDAGDGGADVPGESGDSGGDAEPDVTAGGGGCSCSVPAVPPSGAWLIALVPLALALRRSRPHGSSPPNPAVAHGAVPVRIP